MTKRLDLPAQSVTGRSGLEADMQATVAPGQLLDRPVVSMATEVSSIMALQNSLVGRVRKLSVISRRIDRSLPLLAVGRGA